MKEILLTKGQKTIIDDEDFEFANQFKWYADKHVRKTGVLYYAARRAYFGSESKFLLLQNVLINPPHGFVVDHINHNTLDNRRCNLRLATKTQNRRNSKRLRGRSGFIGVAFYEQKQVRPYQSRIECDGQTYHLGYFEKGEDAARAYDKKARELFGEFAVLNFPEKEILIVKNQMPNDGLISFLK